MWQSWPNTIRIARQLGLFSVGTPKLQEDYQKLQKEKEEKVKEVKDSGLGLYKAVKAARKNKTEL